MVITRDSDLSNKKSLISSFIQTIADKGKNAARGRRGLVYFLLHNSMYHARYKEQVCSN